MTVEHRTSTNHAGWEVQQWTKEKGWHSVTKPYPTYAEAEQNMKPDERVYEALK